MAASKLPEVPASAVVGWGRVHNCVYVQDCACLCNKKLVYMVLQMFTVDSALMR